MNYYEFYIKKIKPIEKKYTRLCILYSLFKFKCYKKERDFYNKLLITYYKYLKNNPNHLKVLASKFNN